MGQPVMQWQILAKNPEACAAFYTSLFDWRVAADNALQYRQVDTGSGRGIGGGIWPSPPEGHPMVQLFIEVDDVAAYVRKATSLGATVIIPPQKMPDGDELAVVLDTEGLPFGLYRPKP